MSRKRPHDDMKLCGAKTRSGSPCRQPAMANGRCRLHGGKSLRGIAHPGLVTGRYSKDLPTRLLERYEAAVSDPDLLNLNHEIAVIDARVMELVGKLDTGEASKLWFELQAAGQELQAAQALRNYESMAYWTNEMMILVGRGASEASRWGEIYELFERRRRLVDSERKRREAMQNFITAEQQIMLITTLVDLVRSHVSDKKALAAISAGLAHLVADRAGRGT